MTIFRYLSFDVKHKNAKLARMTGLQLLGVVLSCGAPAYDPIRDKDISEFRFFEQLLSNLNIPTKPIYRATAEVCGLALKQAAEKGGGSTSVDYKVYTTLHDTT